MAATTTMCDSFKKEVLMGTHLFKATAGNTFKIALIKSGMTGTYGTASTNYSNITGNSDEATDTSGNNQYTAGGVTLATNADPTISTNVAYIDWATDPSWGPAATISAAACMIYNSSASNAAVGVFDFGGTKASTTGTFTVVLPAPAYNTAIIRI